MEKLIAGFPEQLEEGIDIGKKARIQSPKNKLEHILIAGMGGSGIGGRVVSGLVASNCSLPIHFIQDYRLPAWVNKHSLGILSSYSGNTEETFSVAEELLERESKAIAVTSGGKLAQLAESNDLDQVTLPGGWPAPRACLGFSAVAQVYVLYHLKLIDFDPEVKLQGVIRFLRKEQESIRAKARQIAYLLQDKMPVIYSTSLFEPAGSRLQQQLNENAKVLALKNVIPEMNHNEIVGWHQHNDQLAVLLFLSQLDHPRNQLRNRFVQEVTGHFAGSLINIQAKGADLWEQMFFLIHLADWISFELADLRSVDIMSIKAIDALKEMLQS
jgi:glucose/mannose-6-phosphate isomerase